MTPPARRRGRGRLLVLPMGEVRREGAALAESIFHAVAAAARQHHRVL